MSFSLNDLERMVVEDPAKFRQFVEDFIAPIIDGEFTVVEPEKIAGTPAPDARPGRDSRGRIVGHVPPPYSKSAVSDGE